MQIWDAFAVRTSLWLRVSSFLHRHFMRIYVIAKVKKLLDCIFTCEICGFEPIAKSLIFFYWAE